ncbi:hypothetical protein GF322_02505 [Candidatus Dependentiae bacterium]|nr:hypothetical protein [Candidatus Dependentiae bacterium]
MKKKFIIFTFLLLFINSSYTSDEQDENQDINIEIIELSEKTNHLKTMFDSASQACISSAHYSKLILYKFGEIFQFIVDKADKLTSKKFIIAIFFSVGPLVSVYCKFFDPEPLKILINKFFSTTTENAIKIGAPAAQGVAEGTLNGILNNKASIAKLVALGTGVNIIYSVLNSIIIKTGSAAGPYITTQIGYGLLSVSSFILTKVFNPVVVLT